MSANRPKSSGKGSVLLVSVAVFGSRLMGLVREQVFAYMFGATMLSDVYQTAFRIPNLLRDLFAEGALSTAFTTTFTKLWAKDGPEAAWRLAEIVITMLICLMGLICLVGIIASPWVVSIISPGFFNVPGKYEATVKMTQVLFPFLLFVSLAAVAMGMLNSRNIFGIPASASTAFNIVSVLTGVTLALIFDPPKDWHHPHFGISALYGMCIGVLVGGLAQLWIQLPMLWKLGFRFGWRPEFRDPALHTVLALMIPSALAGSAVQINVLVNSVFASHIDGAQSWLNYSFRFVQLPIGIFGVAIATVTLPAVARQHALEDLKKFGEIVQDALRFGFYLTVPSSVGLAVVAYPLIALIYQRGAFDAHSTAETAWALQAYTVGLAGYSGIKILVPCFYALNETRTPLRVSFTGIGLNLVLNGVLFFYLQLGHVGLALTTGLVAVFNFAQLTWSISRKISLGSLSEWLFFFGQIAVASLACGGIAKLGLVYVWPMGHGSLSQGVLLMICIGAAAGTYFSLTVALRVPESMQLVNAVLRRVKR